jgi:uncharacterized membrane protein HdeD (DUF308 family)
MDDLTQGLVQKGLPWSRDVKWPVVAAEAAVLIGIGAYMLFDKDGAADIVLQLIGVVLLVTSLVLGLAGVRNEEATLGFFDAFRAGIGAACGAIATVSWWSDYIQNSAVRQILGWGLIAYSVLHLVGLVVVRGRSGLRPSVIVTVAATLVLGIMLLTSDSSNASDRITLLGWTFLVFGVLLGALAYYLFSRKQPSAPAPEAA